jgi:2-C-methyl-D-erythritol 4-phosphate cytidylyltransferase
MHVTAIVPAAGGGTRLSGPVPKQYLSLTGVPLLTRTLQALWASGAVTSLILVIPPGHEARCRAEIQKPFGVHVDAVVPGGADRQASVYAGLLQIPPATEIVLVHDGARPFVTPEIVRAAVAAAAEVGAAVAAIPVTDTIKVAAADGRVLETPARGRLWAAQTPQAFRAPLFLEAHARALTEGFRGTDDSVLVERLGRPVCLVPGSPENFKVTTWEDLPVAEEILRARAARTG